MPNERFVHAELALLTIVLIVARRAIGGPPIFRSEFVIEDFVLLLSLVSFVAHLRFKRLIGLMISCLLSTTMALVAWTNGSRGFSLLLFTSLAIYSLVLALIELSNLRRHGLNSIRHQ
jgi:hypothetical protein